MTDVCVQCGDIWDQYSEQTDMRGRKWCNNCAERALAKVEVGEKGGTID